jgi:hypothetical protein
MESERYPRDCFRDRRHLRFMEYEGPNQRQMKIGVPGLLWMQDLGDVYSLRMKMNNFATCYSSKLLTHN